MQKERARANGTFMSRRHILAALPLAAVPVPALADPAEDPIVPHYRDWLAARAEWYRLSDLAAHERWDTPEMREAEEREFAALESMIETPPETFAGVAALAHAIWNWSGPTLRESHPEFPDQCRSVESRLIAALWRATSGKQGLPPPPDPWNGR